MITQTGYMLNNNCVKNFILTKLYSVNGIRLII